MWAPDFLKAIKSPEQRLAWLVAVAADAIQIVALPLFAGGGLSPADTLLDLVVATILTRCLGWHWAFLPTPVSYTHLDVYKRQMEFLSRASSIRRMPARAKNTTKLVACP